MKEKESTRDKVRMKKKNKKRSSTLTARNKAELLMLEGGCMECSRWKKQEEMWKITYYTRFRKWLDSCTVLSLFFHFIFLRSVTAIKYYFPPMNLLISAIDKSRLPFTFSTHMQPSPSAPYSHSMCPHLPSHWSKHLLYFAVMGWWGRIGYQSAGLYTCTSSVCVW